MLLFAFGPYPFVAMLLLYTTTYALISATYFLSGTYILMSAIRVFQLYGTLFSLFDALICYAAIDGVFL